MECVEASACHRPSAPTSSATWTLATTARRRPREPAPASAVSAGPGPVSCPGVSRRGRGTGVRNGDLFAQAGPDLFVQFGETRLEPHLAHAARPRQVHGELLLHCGGAGGEHD